ncbi:hypothetical protein F5X98DRAFT_334920 [Xylaria grammica]|nr:hypothetical protein F5X98DRAFT_334920 [Xylaria grammica]
MDVIVMCLRLLAVFLHSTTWIARSASGGYWPAASNSVSRLRMHHLRSFERSSMVHIYRSYRSNAGGGEREMNNRR